MANTAYDYYMNQRSWLIDTAETPEDKKNLKRELAALDAKYYKNRISKVPPTKPRVSAGVKKTTKTVNKTYRPMGN